MSHDRATKSESFKVNDGKQHSSDSAISMDYARATLHDMQKLNNADRAVGKGVMDQFPTMVIPKDLPPVPNPFTPRPFDPIITDPHTSGDKNTNPSARKDKATKASGDYEPLLGRTS